MRRIAIVSRVKKKVLVEEGGDTKGHISRAPSRRKRRETAGSAKKKEEIILPGHTYVADEQVSFLGPLCGGACTNENVARAVRLGRRRQYTHRKKAHNTSRI